MAGWVGAGFERYRCFMLQCDLFGYPEAETGSHVFFLGGKEGFKQPGLDIRVDAHSVVVNADYGSVSACARCDLNFSTRADSVDRIRNEVGKELHQFSLEAENDRGLVG